jgi:hypothetical protein
MISVPRIFLVLIDNSIRELTVGVKRSVKRFYSLERVCWVLNPYGFASFLISFVLGVIGKWL